MVNGKYFQKNAVPGWYLCHGIVINSKDGLPMLHCWIEVPKMFKVISPSGKKTMELEINYIIDKSNGNDYDGTVALYYLVGEIDPKDVVRYDLSQYCDMIIQEGYYGPWEIECGR